MFGAKLRELRLIHGYTQQEVGDMVDVTAGTIGMWEQERRTPPLAKMQKLASILGVSPSFFVEENQPDDNTPAVWLADDEVSEFFLKYYRLDDFGREAVENLISTEFKRCAVQKNLRDADITIQLSKKKTAVLPGKEDADV